MYHDSLEIANHIKNPHEDTPEDGVASISKTVKILDRQIMSIGIHAVVNEFGISSGHQCLFSPVVQRSYKFA